MAGDQDMFDAVVMADERFHGEGYREGYEEGSSLGMIEGRQHGTLHGAKIGSEIGCYQGFAFAWRGLLHSCATERDRHPCRSSQSESSPDPTRLQQIPPSAVCEDTVFPQLFQENLIVLVFSAGFTGM
ncbi:protein LTO1 homolog isoform X2 [Bubalus kerabau]|uniref:protein LTO1 homolog isoform X3 n=1 Tax=Bubalus bubalis TaxID=89462 RepID=UPI000DBC5728|nr:protein LTO1 homolog isoform X3 [Bubalus bubalis]XP_055436556.1 protein LTO1 homolog isoform X2 [Bubalus carabanensis]